MSSKEEISWDQYKVFLEVYEAGSYSEPARRAGLTRFAMMYHIRELSKKLGVTLFVNNSHGVEPTSAANDLYPAIKKVAGIIGEREENVKEFDKKKATTIRIGVSPSLLFILSPYIKKFCAEYPKAKLMLYNKESAVLLEQNKIDLIVDIDTQLKRENFTLVKLFSQAAIFVANKEIAPKTNISKTELLKLPIIGYIEEVGGTQHADFLESNKFFIEAATAQSVYALVKNGIGIGCFYEKLFVAMNDPGLERIIVDGMDMPEINIVCAYKNYLTKASKTFVEGLVDFCGTL